MVVTRSGAGADAEWRKRVISNVAPCPPNCAIANRDYYTQEDVSLVENGCLIRVFNKADLSWRMGTVVRNASAKAAQSHVKMVRFGADETGALESVDLFRCFWNNCDPRAEADWPRAFSITLTDAQNARVDNLFTHMQQEPAQAYMFPWSNTGPVTWALRDLNTSDGLFSDQVLPFFEQAVIENLTHPVRKRFLVLCPSSIPRPGFFQGIAATDVTGRRSALKDFAGRLGLPSLHTLDFILVPMTKDEHLVLVAANVLTRTVFLLDPVGVDRTHITAAQRSSFCQALDDLWSRDLKNLGMGTSYFRKARLVDERKMFADYDLPLQPVGPQQTDHNCAPLVCLYLVTIASGRKFDYGPFEPYREAMRQGMEQTDPNWLAFARGLRRKIASVIAEYGDNFRFMI